MSAVFLYFAGELSVENENWMFKKVAPSLM